MAYHLDSALVIPLRGMLRWESSLETSGTLTAVAPGDALNPGQYQERDRQLAYRDSRVAAAAVKLSASASDVYGARLAMPGMEAPAMPILPYAGTEMPGAKANFSQVRHVTNGSVAYDAARYADADLYARDLLVYETLVRTGTEYLVAPPLVSVDAHGSIAANGTLAWSTAEGAPVRADINGAQVLTRDTFKAPDTNLADRDNQLAGYAAQIAKLMRSPLEYAERLYARSAVYPHAPIIDDTDNHLREDTEPELYVLSSDANGLRVWTSEPAYLGRNRIVYDRAANTLQWVNESLTSINPPQLVAMIVPASTVGYTGATFVSPGFNSRLLGLTAGVPEASDCQFWRAKAAKIVPSGVQHVDTSSVVTDLCVGSVVTRGYRSVEGAFLPVIGSFDFDMQGTGARRVSLLATPTRKVTLHGGLNVSSYGTETRDATYCGAPFIGGNLRYRLALPVGTWKVSFTYTNAFGPSDGFGIKAQYAPTGQAPVTVINDDRILPAPSVNGTAMTSLSGLMSVSDTDEIDLTLSLTHGSGQPRIIAVTFEYAGIDERTSYDLSLTCGGIETVAQFTAEIGLPVAVSFDVSAAATGTSYELWLSNNPSVPLAVSQACVTSTSAYTSTLGGEQVPGWRYECLNRALRSIQQNYTAYVAYSGTNVPDLAEDGSEWTAQVHGRWNSLIESSNPRCLALEGITSSGTLRSGCQYEITSATGVYNGTTYAAGAKVWGTDGAHFTSTTVARRVGAFKRATPAHVGRPALIPYGLYVTSAGTASCTSTPTQAAPQIVACQPWMVPLGVYVADADFWQPDNL